VASGRRLATLVLALLALLLVPAAAGATTYCVSKPACVTAGGTSEPDLQTALTTAAGSPGRDRVELGPGIYSRAAGFSYVAVDPVDLVGNGTQSDWSTVATLLLDGTANPTSETVLTLLSSTPSTVSNLAIQLPTGTGNSNTGLALTNGTATGVFVRGINAASVPTGVKLTDSAFVGGRVDTPSSTATGIRAVSGSLNRIADAAIDVDATGVFADNGTSLRLERSRIGFDANGVAVGAATNVSIDSTSFALRGESPFVFGGGINFLGAAGGNSSVDAHNVTILGNGQPSEYGVQMFNGASRTISLNLVDSVISGFPTAIRRQTIGAGARADVTTDHSAYAPVADVGTVNGTLSENGRLSIADPGFLDAAHGDVHLRTDSPLVDAGSSGPGGGSATDLAGQPRVADGNNDCTAVRDIGAYELQLPPHSCTPTIVTVTVPAPKAFAGVSIRSHSATERKGAVGIALACPAGTNGRCGGSLSLAAPSSSRHGAKRVKLGSARFSVAAGKRATVSVKLSRSGLALLHARHALKATATAAAKDSAGASKTTTASVTLKAAAPARHRR
jgi:hypothetical protein